MGFSTALGTGLIYFLLQWMGLLPVRLAEATLLKTLPWNYPYLSCSLIPENICVIFRIKASGRKKFLCCVTSRQQPRWYKSGFFFFLELSLTVHPLSAPPADVLNFVSAKSCEQSPSGWDSRVEESCSSLTELNVCSWAETMNRVSFSLCSAPLC